MRQILASRHRDPTRPGAQRRRGRLPQERREEGRRRIPPGPREHRASRGHLSAGEHAAGSPGGWRRARRARTRERSAMREAQAARSQGCGAAIAGMPLQGQRRPSSPAREAHPTARTCLGATPRGRRGTVPRRSLAALHDPAGQEVSRMQDRRARSRPDGPDQSRSDGPTAATDDHAGLREGRSNVATGGLRRAQWHPQRPRYCRVW